MNSLKPERGRIIEINAKFLHGFIALALAGFFWWITSKEWWAFGILAWMALLGGSAQIIQTLNLVRQMIVRDRALKEFETKGAEPKADSLAGNVH